MRTPSGGSGGATVPRMSPIETVNRFLGALEALDLDAALELLADEVVYHNVGLPEARGKGAVKKQLSMMVDRFDRFEVQMKNIAASGPIVLTERVDVLEFAGFRLAPWVCGTFEVRDGRIVLWRDYFDWAQMTGQVLRGAPVAAARSALRLLGMGSTTRGS